jgi:hypothetical protein
LLFGSMRFSTAASGTSLTRTQIFKSGSYRLPPRGFQPRDLTTSFRIQLQIACGE